jgi:hypothetical protein
MSEKKLTDDARSKFREALEKKKQKGTAGTAGGPARNSKVGEGQASGGASRRFQRKSGSA